MDPPHPALARIAPDGQLAGRRSEEAGRVPPISAPAQAAARPAKGKARDQLQHAADEAAPVEPARLHADRGQDGVGEFPVSFAVAITTRYRGRTQSLIASFFGS